VDANDSLERKDVPSTKKLLQGNAYLVTRKNVLGWIIDTVQGTLELPLHRLQHLLEVFDTLWGRCCVGIAEWHRVLGELWSMTLAIPGSRGLFSCLQTGFQHTDAYWIRMTKEITDQLADFEHLAWSLAQRPMRIAKIVPDHPVVIGLHNVSGLGMGGIWLPATTNTHLQPILWQTTFPPEIVTQLVSFDNPAGTVNNSELELAGMIAHQDVLVQEVNCAK
jgi:hypothetical protein